MIGGYNSWKKLWKDILIGYFIFEVIFLLGNFLIASWGKYYVTFLLEIDHEVLAYGEISTFSVFFIQSNFDRMLLLSKNTLLEYSP